MERVGLEPFLAIAKHHNFRRAAAELGVSPSALSHSLRALETRLGVRLLNRTTRSVALTEAGQRLLARVGPAYRDIDEALEELNAFRDRPAGTLRINAGRGAVRMVMLPIVARFLARHPDVRVELTSEEALVDVVSGGFDAGVRLGETVAADMVATPIGPKQSWAVVGSPAFFARHAPPKTPHELRGLPCVRHRFASGSVYQWEFERKGVELTVEVEGPLVLTDMDLMIDAALTGVGLVYAFEHAAREHIERGTLVQVLRDWCPSYPGFFLYYPSRQRQPAVLRAFVEFVRGELTPG